MVFSLLWFSFSWLFFIFFRFLLIFLLSLWDKSFWFNYHPISFLLIPIVYFSVFGMFVRWHIFHCNMDTYSPPFCCHLCKQKGDHLLHHPFISKVTFHFFSFLCYDFFFSWCHSLFADFIVFIQRYVCFCSIDIVSLLLVFTVYCSFFCEFSFKRWAEIFLLESFSSFYFR